MPAVPGAPSVFRWAEQDLNLGTCIIGDVDGTGHVALAWDNSYQPHDTRYIFIDPSTNASAGSYAGTRLYLIGQASGFIAGECLGGSCFQDYVVLGPKGEQVFKSKADPATPMSTTWMWQANDPTGGMIHTRLKSDETGTRILLDAIDPAGAIRWTRQISAVYGRDAYVPGLTLGVDRKGNVLALWLPTADAPVFGQWFDHDGNAGNVFVAIREGTGFVSDLFERVGDGLLAYGHSAVQQRGWIGQFEPLAATMSPPPDWLEARKESQMHMVHGGSGYAMLSNPGTSSTCEQSITVVSPSGQVCGTATFSVGGGTCTTRNMVVGYDGTVVQQLPRERENECKYNDHVCDCTYRYWPGYFR